MTTPEDLNARLLEAHAKLDQVELIVQYTAAADLAIDQGDQDRAAFFLTYAWIFALEIGHQNAETLEARLRCMGRL